MYVHMHKLVRFKLVYTGYIGVLRHNIQFACRCFHMQAQIVHVQEKRVQYKFIDSLPRMCKQTLHIKVDGRCIKGMHMLICGY